MKHQWKVVGALAYTARTRLKAAWFVVFGPSLGHFSQAPAGKFSR